MTRAKLLNMGLIATSLLVYFEWGGDHSTFLLLLEWELASKLFVDPVSVLHPFTVLPLFGQILLLFTLFQNQPSRKLSLIGMLFLGFLIYFVLFIGVLALNIKISLLATPYVIVSFLTLKHHRLKGK
ncbi:MAG: hypothetical protein ABJG47_12505 [Ekhidna sp.]